MKFRPCIDIHNGKVKQIVGSSLRDEGDRADENFISDKGAGYFARLYTEAGLSGGHVILLNPASSPYYEATRAQALEALRACPGKFHAGGGITPDNASVFLDAGASHVIVTSYVFSDGRISGERLSEMENAVGRRRLVLDLSCRKKDGRYYIVTNRWQTFTRQALTNEFLEKMAEHCDEFLVHAVDAEGKAAGVDEELIRLLSRSSGIPITYAGGIASYEDIDKLKEYSAGKIDFTVGSALSLFGGKLELRKILELTNTVSRRITPD